MLKLEDEAIIVALRLYTDMVVVIFGAGSVDLQAPLSVPF